VVGFRTGAKRFVILGVAVVAAVGVAVVAGCAPAVITDPIQLDPANPIALQDGTPIALLSGYAGNPRATVRFVFADGDTLTGDALMHGDFQNSLGIWGQTARRLSSNATVEMVAIDGRQEMDCRGFFGPQATHLVCNLSDGAVYRDDYTAALPRKSR
jgi:hypothetical protein